jgi:hypothetical protein
MKNIYEVVAVKNSIVNQRVQEDGYVVYRSFQTADSGAEAVETVLGYFLPPGTQYDSIRAEFVRVAD